MSDYAEILARIQRHPRYLANLSWGQPRPGHPEGTIAAHIAELEGNLERLAPRLSGRERDLQRLLIHTHDTFKPQAREGIPILSPESHASMARAFLAEFTDDAGLLDLVQFHDESYAIWRNLQQKGVLNRERLERLLERGWDWDMYIAFLIIDGCTGGKSRAPLRWFFAEIEGKVKTRWGRGGAAEILE